jgi:hypothetical protein
MLPGVAGDNAARRVPRDEFPRLRWTGQDGDEETHPTFEHPRRRNCAEAYRRSTEEFNPNGPRPWNHGTHHVIGEATAAANPPGSGADSTLLPDVAAATAVFTAINQHRGAVRTVTPSSTAKLPVHSMPSSRLDVRLDDGTVGRNRQQQAQDRYSDDEPQHAFRESSRARLRVNPAYSAPRAPSGDIPELTVILG